MERNATEETQAPGRRVAVYRAYDVTGALLYVGASIDPGARMRGHKNTSQWWHLHSWFDVQWFANSEEASAAEFRAICDEDPRFNKVGVTSAYFPHGHYGPRQAQPSPSTRIFWSVTEIAARTGLTVNTVKTYTQIPGRLPPPDAMIGRVKCWLPGTINAWTAERRKP